MKYLLSMVLATVLVFGGCTDDDGVGGGAGDSDSDSDNQNWSITVPCETGFHITVGSDTWDLTADPEYSYCGDYSGEGADAEFFCEGGDNNGVNEIEIGFCGSEGLDFFLETEALLMMGYIQGDLEHEVIGDKITGNFIGSGEVYTDDEYEPSIKDVEICFKELNLMEGEEVGPDLAVFQ